MAERRSHAEKDIIDFIDFDENDCGCGECFICEYEEGEE